MINLIDLFIVILISVVTALISCTPKIIKKIRDCRYINAIRKQNKIIKSISSEYDDYEDDFYALELEKSEYEMNRLKSISTESNELNQTTTNSYYFEETKVNFLMNAVSMITCFQTSVSLLGLPVEFYYYGLQSFQFCLGVLIAPVVITLIFVPFLYKLKSKSIYEYIDNKFDSGSQSVKMLTLFIVIIFQIIFASLVLYTTSLTIMQMLPVKSLSLWHCASTLGVISALLAMLGLKSIIWANFFQYTIIIICNVLIVIFGLKNLSSTSSIMDGFAQAWNMTESAGRININILNENTRNRFTFWNCLFGLAFNAIPSYCLTQQSYQRIRQAKSATSAKLLILTIIPFGFMNLFLILSVGFIMFVYFYRCGDPITNKSIQKENQLIVYFLNRFYEKHSGLLGFYLACLISSTIGTLASILKGLSVTLVEDIFTRLCTKNNLDRKNTQKKPFYRKYSRENNEYSFEKEYLNLQAKWNPNRKKKKILKKFAAKHNKKFANKNITLASIFICSLITIGISVGLEIAPVSLVSTAMSLLYVLHGPLLFIFLCARFNHFALKRNHFALNTRSTASRLKNMRIHHVDVIISCVVSITLVGCLYGGHLMTLDEADHFYNSDKLPTNFYTNKSIQICLNSTTSLPITFSNPIDRFLTLNSSSNDQTDQIKKELKLSILNYLFAISFNWYPLIGFIICCLNLFILSTLRFIFACSCSKKKRSRK